MKRLRRRYVVIRRDPASAEPSLSLLQREFKGLQRVKLEGVEGFVVLRCTHLQLPELKRRLNALGLQVVGVSGTIKRAIKKFIRKS